MDREFIQCGIRGPLELEDFRFKFEVPTHLGTALGEGWGECPHEPIPACFKAEPGDFDVCPGSTESRPTGLGAGSAIGLEP